VKVQQIFGFELKEFDIRRLSISERAKRYLPVLPLNHKEPLSWIFLLFQNLDILYSCMMNFIGKLVTHKLQLLA